MRGKMWRLRAFIDHGYFLGLVVFHLHYTPSPTASATFLALYSEELVLRSYHQASLVGFCQRRQWLGIKKMRRGRLGNSFLACCYGFEMISFMDA